MSEDVKIDVKDAPPGMITPKTRVIGKVGEVEILEIYPDPAVQAGLVFAEIDDPVTDETPIVPFSESLLYVEWMDLDLIVHSAESMA